MADIMFYISVNNQPQANKEITIPKNVYEKLILSSFPTIVKTSPQVEFVEGSKTIVLNTLTLPIRASLMHTIRDLVLDVLDDATEGDWTITHRISTKIIDMHKVYVDSYLNLGSLIADDQFTHFSITE